MSELTGDAGAVAARLSVRPPAQKAPALATDGFRPDEPATGTPSLPPVEPAQHLDPVSRPTAGLAALLAQARLAQGQLASQPLPISNHQSLLIMKLFGG